MEFISIPRKTEENCLKSRNEKVFGFSWEFMVQIVVPSKYTPNSGFKLSEKLK